MITGTYNLFAHTLEDFGISTTFVDDSKLSNFEDAIKINTKAIFIESLGNPNSSILDINEIAKIAHKNGIPLIVDNTFLSPYFQNPLDLGADIVVHSGTKFIGGHNDTLAGFLVVNSKSLSERLRFILKTVGSCLSPFDSWLILRGVKTLALRMERQQTSAIKIANWLTMQPQVKKVYYPGLLDHPGYEISIKQSRGFGSMLTFEVASKDTAVILLEAVQLIQYAESLGGVETLITYPITQTHADVPCHEREKNGITDSVLRLSVGIEDVTDLIFDLEQAFSKTSGR
ncbi:MAG: aminotransferase class I/II-fold pyridoxal phosphate-dependent enzyme [Clostridiales bacterium]|nr:aminotransferase class I/II-fold pyridoxal phosphate-dependent enzyme [Clostridiales bacterium]